MSSSLSGRGTSLLEELAQTRAHAEEHAFSVRQLHAQRSRLFEIIRLASRASGSAELSAVGAAVEFSKAQFYQDIYCLFLNGGKRNGFFVEFGACDGLLISNTWLMETQFGWRGILAEPARSWHDELTRNRSCIIDKRCVWSETGKNIEFVELMGDEYHTQSTVNTHNELEIAAKYEVETVSLADLLAAHDAPRRIDFASLDVEGHELTILKSFPFERYSFDFLCVEHRKFQEEEVPIKAFLEDVGYRQILRPVSGHDGIYIPRDAHPHVE